MRRYRAAILTAVACLVVAVPAPRFWAAGVVRSNAFIDPFYERLYREGIEAYRSERWAEARRKIRIAAFGLLDVPEKLADALGWLIATMEHEGEQDRQRAMVLRLVEIHDRFLGDATFSWPPEICARVNEAVRRHLSEEAEARGPLLKAVEACLPLDVSQLAVDRGGPMPGIAPEDLAAALVFPRPGATPSAAAARDLPAGGRTAATLTPTPRVPPPAATSAPNRAKPPPSPTPEGPARSSLTESLSEEDFLAALLLPTTKIGESSPDAQATAPPPQATPTVHPQGRVGHHRVEDEAGEAEELLDRGDLAGALEAAARRLRATPNQPEATCIMGIALAGLREWSRALPYLERFPSCRTTLRGATALANGYLMTGRRLDALRVLETLPPDLKGDPAIRALLLRALRTPPTTTTPPADHDP